MQTFETIKVKSEVFSVFLSCSRNISKGGYKQYKSEELSMMYFQAYS